MWYVSGYNDEAIKTICYDCGSAMARRSYNFFRRANYRAGQAKSIVWCNVFYEDKEPKAFYYACKCRRHVRLIEIAVRKDSQRQGVGKLVLNNLLLRMKDSGLSKLTFLTPITEEAQGFWLHMGGAITDVKGDDYEMEITIKLDNDGTLRKSQVD